jgi:hypothetical protein
MLVNLFGFNLICSNLPRSGGVFLIAPSTPRPATASSTALSTARPGIAKRDPERCSDGDVDLRKTDRGDATCRPEH